LSGQHQIPHGRSWCVWPRLTVVSPQWNGRLPLPKRPFHTPSLLFPHQKRYQDKTAVFQDSKRTVSIYIVAICVVCNLSKWRLYCEKNEMAGLIIFPAAHGLWQRIYRWPHLVYGANGSQHGAKRLHPGNTVWLGRRHGSKLRGRSESANQSGAPLV